MRVIAIGLASITALSSTGCATTDPLGGANVQYRLPRGDAKVALSLTLRSCEEPPIVDAEVTTAAVPGAQGDWYQIKGQDLASARIKRTFGLSLAENGVLTGINSAAEDKSPAIIGNVLKTVAKIAGFVAPAQPVGFDGTRPDLACNATTLLALKRADWLSKDIARLRGRLADASTADDAQASKVLQKQIIELAALLVGPLRVETTGDVKLNRGETGGLEKLDGDVDLGWGAFAKWFKPEGKEVSKWGDKTSRDAWLSRRFGMRWAAQFAAQETVLSPPIIKCGFAVAVPSPRSVQVDVFKSGSALPDDAKGKVAVPAAQFGTPNNLCLDVGFGESRSINVAYDKFGRQTTYAWASEATAATVSAAIAGSTDDAISLAKTLRGPDEATREKSEIDDLKRRKELNQLRACEAIIDAGGYDCTAKAD